MPSVLERLGDRLLAMLGVDLDFDIEMGDRAFHRITPALYLGARPRPEELPALREAGITHVVSCLTEDKRPEVAFVADAFDALFLELHDGIHEDVGALFPPFFEFAEAARRARDDARLLVHCEAGVSRSATLVTALLMKSEQISFFDAYSRVRARRHRALPNIGFASQLQRLEHDLLPRRETGGGPSSLSRYLREICNAPVETELLESMLRRHDYDAVVAIRAIFGDDIPRVIQGVRV